MSDNNDNKEGFVDLEKVDPVKQCRTCSWWADIRDEDPRKSQCKFHHMPTLGEMSCPMWSGE